MPTAVEFKLEAFIASFLKLDGVDGRGQQASLRGAFQKIDAAFSSLSTASIDTIGPLEATYAPTFQAIGGAFGKLDGNFRDVASIGSLLDIVIGKLDGPVSPGAQRDFLGLESSLKLFATGLGGFGTQFLELDKASSSSEFQRQQRVACDGSVRLGSEAHSLGAAFDMLGTDLTKLGRAEPKSSALHADYLKLGAAMASVAGELATAAADFGVLAGLLLPAVRTNGAASGGLGAEFLRIDADFLKLDTGLAAFAGPSANLLYTELKANGLA